MKLKKIIFLFSVLVLTAISCKTSTKNNNDKPLTTIADYQKVQLKISGMTCEIGCAKLIQSKLLKKTGIAKAQVVFKDSLAIVQYDANKISKEKVITFIDGIASGLYKASEITN